MRASRKKNFVRNPFLLRSFLFFIYFCISTTVELQFKREHWTSSTITIKNDRQPERNTRQSETCFAIQYRIYIEIELSWYSKRYRNGAIWRMWQLEPDIRLIYRLFVVEFERHLQRDISKTCSLLFYFFAAMRYIFYVLSCPIASTGWHSAHTMYHYSERDIEEEWCVYYAVSFKSDEFLLWRKDWWRIHPQIKQKVYRQKKKNERYGKYNFQFLLHYMINY